MEVLAVCCQLLKVCSPPILIETELVQSPALYGFLRPKLLLPPATLSAFSPSEQRNVFLHEVAHIKRLDMLINWVTTLLQLLHWFNPLVWLAFRCLAAERELAADALALSKLESLPPRQEQSLRNRTLG